MTSRSLLIAELSRIVGAGHVLTAERECPAEHNVGRLGQAKPALAGFCRRPDPASSLIPGLGQASKCSLWEHGGPPA